MSNSCEMKLPDEGDGTYTRRIRISSSCQEEQNLDFYEPPSVAVRGPESICLVLRKMPEDNPEKPDLFKVFPDTFCKQVAIVSVIMTTPGVMSRIKDGRAVHASCNVEEAANFLQKILMFCLPFPYDETIQLAISAYHELIPGGFKANEIEVYVVKSEEKITRALPIKEIQDLLDGSYKATKKFNKLCSSVSLYLHIQERAKPSSAADEERLERLFDGRHYRKESRDEGNGIPYHRRTKVYDDGHSSMILKSPGPSWIGFRAQESLCGVNRVTALGKPEKPDLREIFGATNNAASIVSVALETNEVQDGSVTAVSIDDDDEEKAINFLETALCMQSTFTWEETVQTAISALRYLYGGNLKANEIEVFIARKGNKSTTAFSIHEIEALFDINCKKTESPFPDFLLYSEGTSPKENRYFYKRSLQIWRGGWDSHLLESSRFSWSWIAVQGKNSTCVVTMNKKELDQGFSDVFRHMRDVSPSDKKEHAVSVVVGFDEVDHEESGQKSYQASRAAIKTAEFLMKRINEVSNFTFEVTVQTAISALVHMTQKNLNAREITACVAQVRNYNRLLTVDEIDKHLKKAILEHTVERLMLTSGGDPAAAASSKRIKTF